MKIARGNTRKLLKVIGKLQRLIGDAKNGYMNDRAECRASKVIPPLDEAFELCLETCSEWQPVDDDERSGRQ